MTNEELVEEIRKGIRINPNMEHLYKKNLPLIKKVCKSYAAYESLEDLLQEAYFGLWEAVQRYECSENVSFITYALYWIKQAVSRYVERCGSLFRVPSHIYQQRYQYKKAFAELEHTLQRTPTNEELAEHMGVSVSTVELLELYLQSVVSLDAPLNADSDITVGESIQADFSLEDTVIDDIYANDCKNELWGIVERYTSNTENEILRECFINGKSVSQIANEQGLPFHKVRTIRQNGLRKLNIGRAKRILAERFEETESIMYRDGLSKFKIKMSSTVEHLAVNRVEMEERYKKLIGVN